MNFKYLSINFIRYKHTSIKLLKYSDAIVRGSCDCEEFSPPKICMYQLWIGIARTAFESMAKILTSRNIGIELRSRIANCYIWSTLLYGAETWTLTKVTSDKLEAFEMWLYRRMLKIWKEHQTNGEVLYKMKSKRSLLNTISVSLWSSKRNCTDNSFCSYLQNCLKSWSPCDWPALRVSLLLSVVYTIWISIHRTRWRCNYRRKYVCNSVVKTKWQDIVANACKGYQLNFTFYQDVVFVSVICLPFNQCFFSFYY